MNGVAVLHRNQLKIPQGICKKLHFEDNQKFEVTPIDGRTIQITMLQDKDADRKIKEIVNKGFHLGKVKGIERGAIYEEID